MCSILAALGPPRRAGGNDQTLSFKDPLALAMGL